MSTTLRRVVVTGMGIASCLGNDMDTVSAALRESRPGIRFLPDHAERGLRSQVGGAVDLDLDAVVDRKLERFMSDAPAYSYVSVRDALGGGGLPRRQPPGARPPPTAFSRGAPRLRTPASTRRKPAIRAPA